MESSHKENKVDSCINNMNLQPYILFTVSGIKTHKSVALEIYKQKYQKLFFFYNFTSS